MSPPTITPPPLTHHSSSSSDEPQIVEAPTHLRAGPSHRPASATSKRATSSTASSRNGTRSKGKNRATLVQEDDDDDEPVFVGASMSKLADKYTFAYTTGPSPSSARRTISRSPSITPVPTSASAKRKPRSTGASKSTSLRSTSTPASGSSTTPIVLQEDTVVAPLPLLPDLQLEPAPVPSWLGKTAILLQLPSCVVCKARWKKTDSGAARWRHMSICRPPLYRPPNPPPDLQTLIHEALRSLDGATGPVSLLDLHVRNMDVGLGLEETTSTQATSTGTPGGSKKKAAAPTLTTGLKSFTSVRPSDERGEGWEDEIHSRLTDFLGPSSPAMPESPSRDRVKATSPFVEPTTPVLLTQPLGESSLAQAYVRSPLSARSNRSARSAANISPLHSPVAPFFPDEVPVEARTPPRASMTSIDVNITADPNSDDEVSLAFPISQKRSVSRRLELDQEDGASDDEAQDPDTPSKLRNNPAITPTKLSQPFRPWRDSQVDGGLSKKYRSASEGWKGEDDADSPSNRAPDLVTSQHRANFNQHTPDNYATASVASSATPKGLTSVQARAAPSSSLTPTRAPQTIPIDLTAVSSPTYAADDEDWAWGDDAVISWQATESVVQPIARAGRDVMTISSGDEEDMASVSSVPRSQSGLDLDEDEEEEEGEEKEDDWGKDACIDWAWSASEAGDDMSQLDDNDNDNEGTGTTDVTDEDEEVEQIEMVESRDQLVARGMPDYSSWDLKTLQRLVKSFGYRPSNDQQSLEKVAADCWLAMHPPPHLPPTPNPKPEQKASRAIVARDERESSSSQMSISSEDVPLAQIKQKGKRADTDQSTPRAKGKGKAKAKAKATTKAKPVNEESDKSENLDKRFYSLIKDDEELYIRVLRYEPISFDELISKAIAARIDKRGWRKDLKRYLDLQSITYFTEDPTGQRRRH